MEFAGEILYEISIDPYFKIKFSYKDKNVSIARGFAEVTRIAPKPTIVYDAASEVILRSYDRSKLELELINTVITHLITKGVVRNWKGGFVLSPV